MLFDEEINVKCGKETIKQITLVLNLITKLQKENEEKDKQIDLMLDKINITKPSPCTMTNEYSIGRVYMSKEEKKQYFKNLAKEKDI